MGLFNFVKDAGEKLWDAVTIFPVLPVSMIR